MDETFVLVRVSQSDIGGDPLIEEVIRTYLSRSRAEQDRELLESTGTRGLSILSIPHIDQ